MLEYNDSNTNTLRALPGESLSGEGAGELLPPWWRRPIQVGTSFLDPPPISAPIPILIPVLIPILLLLPLPTILTLLTLNKASNRGLCVELMSAS